MPTFFIQSLGCLIEMNREIEEKVEKIMAPFMEEMGVELYGVKFLSTPAGRVLRLYIDRLGGVDLDTCEKVSMRVSPILDLEDPIPYSYYLEVSSPGIERPLFKKEHFYRYKGERISLKTLEPVEGRRSFLGEIKEVNPDFFVINCDGKEYRIDYENVQKANLVVEIKF